VRTIAAVTGSRAEYGLLQGLLRILSAEPTVALRIVATGSHLSPRFGETWREIESDGFTIDAKVPLPLGDDSAVGTSIAMSAALTGVASALSGLNPDIVVLLGDRYEILAAAVAALLLRIPVAHIHGGEVTSGAMDDAMRHAITKMSHLHFTAAEIYSRRVVQLGEPPENVHTVGAIGLDGLADLPALGREALAKSVGIELGEPLFLVTYHPATLGDRDPGEAAGALIEALKGFPEATLLFTGVNADTGNRAIADRIEKFVALNPGRAVCTDSLGRARYVAAMRIADAVIGNSSSGIIEAPALGTPTVNIGDRQAGRLRSASVVDCPEDARAIGAAIRRAIGAEFRGSIRGMTPAYGNGGAARRIADILRRHDVAHLTAKKFHDLPAAGMVS
jgi:UDP-hydrolysing UDP-N-acetyl-D-glucosamine 2-epimerase